MENKRLNDFFKPDEWLAGAGIFSYLQNKAIPWHSSNISAQLDLMYHGNRSGQKITSPLLDVLESTTANKQYLADCIYARFIDKWGNLWFTLQAQHLLNGDISITETAELDRTDTGTHSRTGSGTDTGTVQDATTSTSTGTVTVTGSSESDTTESRTTGTTTDNETTTTNSSTTGAGVYGFNSATSVPTDTGTGSGSGSEVLDGETHTTESGTSGTDISSSSETENDLTGTENHTRTDNLSHSESESGTTGATRAEEITKTRSGYGGRHTPAGMLAEWLQVWEYDYFLQVFADIDKVLTIMVY